MRATWVENTKQFHDHTTSNCYDNVRFTFKKVDIMRTYVAGSRGLAGSAIVRAAPEGHEIYETSKNDLDLTSSSDVANFLQQNRIETVIIAAARVGGIFINSKSQTKFLLENLKLQNAIIEGSLISGVKNLVFLGSSCIYPRMAQQPITEESILTGALEPTNEGYAIAKIAGVRLCKAIADEYGLNFFSLMPTNLFGPNDNFDLLSSHVPAALMRRFHEAKIQSLPTVGIWGTGKPYREFMHVDDLAAAVWHFIKIKPRGQLINIGSGSELSISDFAHLISQIVKYEGSIFFDQTKPDGAPKKLLDSSKANEMGWSPKIDLIQGLKSTYEWFEKMYRSGELRGY